MIVHMEVGVGEADQRTQGVQVTAERYGLKTDVRVKQGTEHVATLVYLLDGEAQACTVGEFVFSQMAGVANVVRVTPSRVSMVANGTYHRVRIGSAEIGKELPCQVVAGPCVVDRNIDEMVAELARQGVDMIRGGCWKPRSSPYSFPGFGKSAVGWLLEAARRHNISAVFTEVMDETHIQDIRSIKEEVGYGGDVVLWVGARTYNLNLFSKLGRQKEFPVMVKNPLRAESVEEMARVAEFILAGELHFDENGVLIKDQSLIAGNDRLLLCCRGVEHRDPKSPYRFLPHHHWIEVAGNSYWTPVGFDPSHSAGTMRNDFVLRNLQDGLRYNPAFAMIEVGYPT
ncbi:MAG: hypothetical protein Q8P70_01670, partial [bacterium]|nr:hypothetical protein [bacterium]